MVHINEIVAQREKLRRFDALQVQEVERLVYEEEPVMFYEPIKYLDDRTKGHVAQIIEEKLKLLLKRLEMGDAIDWNTFMTAPEHEVNLAGHSSPRSPSSRGAKPRSMTESAKDDMDFGRKAEEAVRRECGRAAAEELRKAQASFNAQLEELRTSKKALEGEMTQRLEESEARHAQTQMMVSEYKAKHQQAQAPDSTMPGTLRASWEATVPHCCDPFWTPTAPSYPSRPGRGVFLEANHSSRSTAFFNIPGINKGIDEDQRTEYGEPFIGNTDAGTVFGPANIMSMGKKRLQGFLKKRLQKAVVDELEMDVNAADLDPLTDNAEAYAVSAQTAAWKATRAAEQSLPREAGLDRIPAKVDYAWKAALQATRMAHSQRLVDQQLNITRQDRRQVSAAVDELVGNIADAVEQSSP
eukprot:s1318_g12.t4